MLQDRLELQIGRLIVENHIYIEKLEVKTSEVLALKAEVEKLKKEQEDAKRADVDKA